MKSLFLLAVLCLPVGQLQHKDNNIRQADPVITWVQTTMSYESGTVSIRGQNLDMVTGVKVAGHAVQVVRNTGSEILIRPFYMNPGFATLELLRSGPSVKGTIEFAPSLRAAWFGDALRIVVNPVEPAQIWLSWSPRSVVTYVDGVYYPWMLDMTAPKAAGMADVSSYSGEPVVIMAPLPSQVGTLELRRIIHLQAFCMVGEDHFACHTNMVRVAPIVIREAKLAQ
jgi:hypothetical protein